MVRNHVPETTCREQQNRPALHGAFPEAEQARQQADFKVGVEQLALLSMWVVLLI